MPNLFVDVRQDVVYAYGWPSRLFQPIYKVKRASKRAYASFKQFSCAITHHFLGDHDSDVKNTKFFRGRPSRRCLCIRLSITAFPTHLEDSDVKNAKFVRGRPSRRSLCIWFAITDFLTHLEGQTSPEANSDVKNAKFVRGRPSRRCLCIRLSITAFPNHLEGQMSPK
uniref:Uncharacterized protein n=1 Tax=Solanum lycopersicum TaxID=4081 RepID=A0A3Q7H2E7_SOLLC